MADLVVPLPRQARLAAGRSAAAHQAAVDESVAALKAPGSAWPVDTGRSKRAWRRLGSGNEAEIYNPVPYASFHRRAAVRTLNRAAGRIVRAARSLAPTAAERDPVSAFVRRRQPLESGLRGLLREAVRRGSVRDRRLLREALALRRAIDREATG